jgi:hypothetical protein
MLSQKVFCCIAIIGIAIVYFIGLWIRQLFLGRCRDAAFATWPPPPRALAGNGAWPVYGHTRLFRRHVGDVMWKFEPQWTEYAVAGRPLGNCFAIFIWGQWRVGIQGPERAQQFFQQPLQEGWPWTPPVTLLGKSCLALLQQEDIGQAKSLRGMLHKPLSAKALQRFAPFFAQAAEQCLLAVEQGVFRKTRSPQKQPPDQCAASPTDDCCEDDEDEDELEEGACCKLKWEALRSYSLDLVNGPLFEMNLWNEETVSPFKTSSHETSFRKEEEPTTWKAVLTKWNTPKHARRDEPPSRELMLLWMERIKLGLDVIKLTFGPEWMYVWMFNEYGRAVNARMYVEKLIGGHVERMAALVPQVTHERGHVYHEPTTQPFPLLALHQNLMHSKEGIFGDFSFYPTPAKSVGVEEESPGNRARCNSMPNTLVAELSPANDDCFASPYVKPFKTEQDLVRVSPVRKPESILPEGTQWGLKEIHLEGFPQGASMSPLSEVGTSPVPQWKVRPTELSAPLTDTNEPTDGIKKPHQKKSVSEVFREIKANRDKQKHLSDENQVVYSFFNPTQRRSFDEADDPPAIKVIKTMNEKKKSTETKQSFTRCAPETSETTEEICKENASQSTQRVSNVNKQIEQRSVTNDTHMKTVSLSSSSSKSANLAGSTAAPPKRFATPQTPMATPFRQQKRIRSAGKKKPVPDTCNANVQSLLQALLQQRGPEGKGISQTTLMELIINIWMMLEVGNAWTTMAMTLLAWDEPALSIIQEELDVLELEFGGELFSPASLDRMKYLDALIYESIRLIPPFLGGLKSTTETVILKDTGVQIPKGSHIFFCQPSRQEFDLFAAVGKRPECLGQQYPCIELFGFLPLQGLEVPLMVLQCKVFLIVTLRNYAPTVSKRNTFIRRVKSAVSFRKIQHAETPEASLRSWAGLTDVAEGSNHSIGAWDVEDGPVTAADQSNHRMTPSEALKRFTKIPFPEPKRVIQLKPRGL